jgi:hypothetical protein
MYIDGEKVIVLGKHSLEDLLDEAEYERSPKCSR